MNIFFVWMLVIGGNNDNITKNGKWIQISDGIAKSLFQSKAITNISGVSIWNEVLDN